MNIFSLAVNRPMFDFLFTFSIIFESSIFCPISFPTLSPFPHAPILPFFRLFPLPFLISFPLSTVPTFVSSKAVNREDKRSRR